MELWEILVPTIVNSKPVRTKHHKEWDKYVISIAGGLSIYKPVKGSWFDTVGKTLHEDRVIPVRIACSEYAITQIVDFTIQHYRQLAVMAYRVSDKVIARRADEDLVDKIKSKVIVVDNEHLDKKIRYR